MRRGITRVALVTAVMAVLVFGVPLAFVVNRLLLGNEQAELEQLALRAAMSIPRDAAAGDSVELPSTEPAVELGVYDASGNRIAGTGPVVADAAVQAALGGVASDQGADGYLVVAVPVSQNEKVQAVARAASPGAAIASRSLGVWLGMIGLALASGTVAGALAIVQSRRLARPIERLEAVAVELGGGNFSARAEPSGIPEIDRAASALNSTAERLGDVVARERAFATHASHQLRTPLTGLRLTLDNALSASGHDLAEAVRTAIHTTDELSRTIDDVLALARVGSMATTSLDLGSLLNETERRWHGLLAAEGRPLRVRVDSPPEVRASEAAVRQIVEVLVDNAYRHGSGAVVITARESSGAAAIDVQDDGSTAETQLLPDGETTGSRHLGLALARRLAEGQNGRLVHAHSDAATRMTLLLPAADADTEAPRV